MAGEGGAGWGRPGAVASEGPKGRRVLFSDSGLCVLCLPHLMNTAVPRSRPSGSGCAVPCPPLRGKAGAVPRPPPSGTASQPPARRRNSPGSAGPAPRTPRGEGVRPRVRPGCARAGEGPAGARRCAGPRGERSTPGERRARPGARRRRCCCSAVRALTAPEPAPLQPKRAFFLGSSC